MEVVSAPAPVQSWPLRVIAARAENGIALTAVAAMVALPLLETSARARGGPGVPGAIVFVQHLTLWVVLLGAALAARDDRLLALSTLRLLPDRWRPPVRCFTAAMASAITAALVWASADFVNIERKAGQIVAFGIPAWLVLALMPVSFGIIGVRLVWSGGDSGRGRTVAALGPLASLAFVWLPASTQNIVLPMSMVAIAAALALGMPIFCAIGGAAALLFWADGTPINAIPVETYRLTTSEILPAVPLFALAGYILADGGASRRLTRLLTALIGWLPGGLALVTTAVLAFFTPLTGASGVTIVSMGGLLLPVLQRARYPTSSSLGLVTVSGSIGLLFFPSLPVFLYAFYANVPYDRLFVGGLVPGVLLVLAVAAWGGVRGWAGGAERYLFRPREAAMAIWEAKWDLALPAIVLSMMLTGVTTLVEAAAVAVLYACVIETLIHRSSSFTRGLPRAGLECVTLIGGFLIILSVALGFSSYLTLLDVPTRLVSWVQTHIESPLLFLLALNILLIIVGAMMDIYSAIVVFVPLIIPLAAAYGIDPVHLGVIFLSNMELGYLMPPMGENLFLSSYRFSRPLSDVYRSTLPYTVILLIVVLVITYAPWLTLALIELFEARGLL